MAVTGAPGDDESTDMTTRPAADGYLQPRTSAELEQVILAFATCVVENKEIALRLRYRTDPFVGLGEEAVIDDPSDLGASRLEQKVEGCRRETGLDDAANAYLDENPPTDGQVSAVVADFEACIGELSGDTQQRVAEQQMVNLDAMAYTGDLFDLAEYGSVVDCRDRAFMGEWRVFGDEALLGNG